MTESRPVSLLLNIGHALDHWVLIVFAYTWGVIAGAWGTDWTELTPYNYGALFMFGAGAIVAGRLGDLWGRRTMMVIFFFGMGISCLVIALCQTRWQIGLALTLMGVFASIYHPVGIPMLVRNSPRPGFTIGVNGLAGNLGVALGAMLSLVLAEHFGWQAAYLVPGAIALACGVAFVKVSAPEGSAPARRARTMRRIPRPLMARIFAVMTLTATAGSIIFNVTTNGNGELLRERFAGVVEDPAMLGLLVFALFALASVAQITVGRLIDRFPIKPLFLTVVALQVPLFLLAAHSQAWAFYATALGFMLLVFGAVPFLDAMVVRYVDDSMRSRVTGTRLAIGFGISSLVVALLGPSVRAAGFTTVLTALALVACVSVLAVLTLPDERTIHAAGEGEAIRP